MAEDTGLLELVESDEFRFTPLASDLDLQRAMSVYIPMLKASYALANAEPLILPPGYVEVAQIRVDQGLMAEAMPADPGVMDAVQNDLLAADAAIADPSAFGFVVREQATGAMLVCLRGTQTPIDWVRNLTAVPTPFSLVPGFGLVHLGFEILHRSVRNSITTALAPIAPDVRITVVGHSLGGAVSTLAAVDLKRNFGRTNVDVATFGCPRVGKVNFRRAFNLEIANCYRVTNQGDIVPHVPSLLTLWNHVGGAIEVDGNLENAHSLDSYLAGLRSIGFLREMSPLGSAVELAQPVMSIRVP